MSDEAFTAEQLQAMANVRRVFSEEREAGVQLEKAGRREAAARRRRDRARRNYEAAIGAYVVAATQAGVPSHETAALLRSVREDVP